MKTFSQITFEFNEPVPSPEEQGVRARIKSLKQEAQPVHEEQPAVVADHESHEASAVAQGLPRAQSTSNIKSSTSKPRRGRRPLKELELEAENTAIPEDEVLFQKQYYTIGEVAEMFRVNTSLIRTWENEFDIIEPRKNRKGDRHFRPIDIKNLVLIHHLIRQRKYTLEGAKDYIKKNKAANERFAMIQSLQKIKGFLLEIKANL